MTGLQELTATEILTRTRLQIEPFLRDAIAGLPAATRRIVAYHLGWEDEDRRSVRADGGKSLRPALVLLAAQALGGRADDALPAAVAVELVHNFSLLHDDVMDADTSRRHRATAWTVFGLGPAILAGDALLGLAFDILSTSGPYRDEATHTLSTAVQELIDGQLTDLEFEHRASVSVDECLRMARLKTGTLLGASTALGAMAGAGTREQIGHLRLYGENLGLAYQYVDDLLGIWGNPSVTGKPVFSDLRRRKQSLPVVTALTSGTEASRELAALYHREGDLTDSELSRAAELIGEAGGREHSQAQAEASVAASLAELAAAGAIGPAARELERLSRLVIRRER